MPDLRKTCFYGGCPGNGTNSVALIRKRPLAVISNVLEGCKVMDYAVMILHPFLKFKNADFDTASLLSLYHAFFLRLR